jgi:hypothetical protein
MSPRSRGYVVMLGWRSQACLSRAGLEGCRHMRPGRSGMAADSEANRCAVLTVDRCAECGRAMCTSHRAMRAPVAEAQAEVARQKAEYAERVRRAYEDVKSIARQLEQAGIRGEKAAHARRLRRTWRGDRYIHDPDRDVYGWFVGEYWWSVQKADYPCGAGRVRTYVTRGGRLIGKLDDIGQETASFQPERDTPFRLTWPIYGPGPATDHLGFSRDEATARQARFWEEVLARLTEWLHGAR